MMATPEQETLKLMFDYLVNSIDAASILPAALTVGLITDYQRSECASEPNPYKKADTFLGHLQRAVNGDSKKFHTFVQLLYDTGHKSNAQRLKDEYSKAKSKARSVSPEEAGFLKFQGYQHALLFKTQQSPATPDPPVYWEPVQPPESDLLAEELGDVEWDMLGTNLGFSQSQIREIEGDYPNISRRRIVMFDKWLRKEVNPSWTKIIAALEKMSEQNLADRLTKKYLQCTAEVSPLQQQQQPKVPPPMTMSKPLTVNNAYKVVIKCSDKWKKLGVLLDVELSDLSKIESAKKDHDDSMIDMLDVWLKSGSNQTWNELADALEQIGETKLAPIVRQNQ